MIVEKGSDEALVEEGGLLLDHQRLLRQLENQLVGLADVAFVFIVDEVAPQSVGTQASGVVGFAKVGLVLGVTDQRSKFVLAMRKLTLFGVLATPVLFKRSAQLRLVATLAIFPAS